MDYKKFKELLSKGECQTLDYKIECNVFGRGNEKDTAELVKDIVAFANNGNVASYLVVGVSNDRNGFKSVENDRLTDDNLQVLVRDNIFPIPKVKLYRCCWSKPSDFRHKGITFVIIQIGPQARQCFRFAKDHIGYDKKFCFKRNEVWIRRQAISDLASPEEIARLLEGKDPIAEAPVENNVVYTRLSKNEFRSAIRKDIIEFASKINATVRTETQLFGKTVQKNWNYLILKNINGKKLNIIFLIGERCNKKGFVSEVCREISAVHHGIILINTANVTPSALEWCPIRIKESWGWFCTNNHTHIGGAIRKLPTSTEKLLFEDKETFCLVLDKVDSTQILQKKLVQMLDTITEKEDIDSHIHDIYSVINGNLAKWRASDCVTDTGRQIRNPNAKITFEERIAKSLKKNEFVDVEKYGFSIMAKNLNMCDTMDWFL
ncbi:helix-turn-helix domain-containing protein [Geosporobacter ferrireducens]|uniref:AlbA family DNA-binding domain-containing protein n=1 Tax=Geosporobacter ferrireducens TaxID=1424294 RepID=UPI00139DC567|nr:ATP-binding protein [Geosporobacter ferrireducens]MTI53752.1 ATP-binding protein [Geosporobacter ferrireducens]